MGRQRDELDAQPGAASRVGDFGIQPIGEPLGVLDQAGGRAELFEVDLRLEVGRPEVPVDQTGDPLVEPQGEEQVVAGDRIRGRDIALAADRRYPASAWVTSRAAVGPSTAGVGPSSPTNGIACRSTASRLIRRAAVFCSATSRT